jgi:hypothetical protein
MFLTALILLAAGQLPVSPDPKPMPISGVVVDNSGPRPGQSVANADVWLAEAYAPDEGRRSGMELWWTGLTPASEGRTGVLVRARTDASGGFTLLVPAEVVAQRSPPPLALWALAPGPERRVTVRHLPRIVLADDPPARLEMGPVVRAELTILGPDQKPVAAATVVPTRAGEIPIPKPLGRLLAITTLADGRAVVPGLAQKAPGEVRIESPGFGTQIIQVPIPKLKNHQMRTL